MKHANEKWDGWVRPPYWDETVEKAFQSRIASGDMPDPWAMVLRFIREGLTVGLREYQGSYCATLGDAERRAAGLSCQLSGWGGSEHEALLVVDYKHRVQLDCDWDAAAVNTKRGPRR